jgi:hypothetical protein
MLERLKTAKDAATLKALKLATRYPWSPRNLEDPAVLRRGLEQVSEEGANVSQLRRNRRAARRAAWRAVEKIARSQCS